MDGEFKVLRDEQNELTYFLLNGVKQINELMNFNYFFRNRSVMEHNLTIAQSKVNPDGYGHARLFKNFLPDPVLI